VFSLSVIRIFTVVLLNGKQNCMFFLFLFIVICEVGFD
jgi:hypothetical protein